MSEPTSGLLDTSVFVANETETPLGSLPDHVAVSVVTIGELAAAHPLLRVLRV